MINKKLSLIAMVAIVAVASTIYGISETQPQTIRYSSVQFGDFTFTEMVDRHAVVVVGEIVDVQVKMLQDNVIGTDENGDKYIYEKNTRPNAKVTIQIDEVLKDDSKLATEKTISFYDEHVDGEIGVSDGHKVQFRSMYSTDYHIGDKGIFMIDNDRKITSMGYTSYYQIIDGKTTTTSELDKLVGNESLDIETAKNTAKLRAES